MICLKPLTITDAMLTSSTLAEPSYQTGAAWVSGTVYAVDTFVRWGGQAWRREFVDPDAYVDFYPGDTWAIGDTAKSAVNGGFYVRITYGSDGSTDCSLDTVNWRAWASTTPDIAYNFWTPIIGSWPDWVSGATYAIGDIVVVAAVKKEYRRLTMGTGTASPETDQANWAERGAYEREWAPGASYEFWDEVILVSTHRRYKRTVAGAGTTAPNIDTANWLDVGPTNKWACFDTLRSTKSAAVYDLQVVITPQTRVRALYLMGLKASSVTVIVRVAGEIVQQIEANLLDRPTTTWSEYFFNGFKNVPAYGIALYPFSAAEITINLTNTAGVVEVGAICLGIPVSVGAAQYTAVSSALNFSKIERDTWGNTALTPSRSVPKTDQVTIVDKALVGSLYDLRTDINAVPCVWSTLDDRSTDGWFKAFLILGVYREFSINAKHPTLAEVTLQIEEV